MSYQAKVIKVLIASPQDVEKERSIARDVILNWNNVHAEKRRIVLLPIGWETHSHPDAGKRPQEIISKQLVSKADILIAIFWTRLGSPTGKADSGTVEEISEFLQAGKKVMLYFSSASTKPDNLDPTQYEKLKAFKSSVSKEALVHTYDNLQSFKDKLQDQLSLYLNEAEDVLSEPITSPKSMITLTSDEKELLQEAAKDSSSLIYAFSSNLGLTVSISNRVFAREGNPREEARWKAAIQGLLSKSLIEPEGRGDEVFKLTHLGFTLVDNLNRIPD